MLDGRPLVALCPDDGATALVLAGNAACVSNLKLAG